MVLEKIRAIISEQFTVDEDSITAETKFEDLGADSLDVVELILAVEAEFDIKVDDGDIENITCVGDIVNYIQSKI